ncbi:contactin-associated protein-like 4 [Lates japonicus]|uniref:Contactin-associated protein-like 4 n=1 Tax=Lates japonicus TaxID=270547 RepID=A0AAD3RIK2_LATJO|nr:contactin-associated protein-like 4 [Lates japonicus]
MAALCCCHDLVVFILVCPRDRLRHSGSVGTGQPLVNAIRSDSALIGGVIAVVIFVTVSALAITARFLYRRKGMCQSQEIKTVKPEDSPELPFSSQTSSHNGPSENQKEYFI